MQAISKGKPHRFSWAGGNHVFPTLTFNRLMAPTQR